jgi:hypothetical protein
MMSNFVALIVEDDPFQRECLADLLKGEGLEVVECAKGEVAEPILASTGPEPRAYSLFAGSPFRNGKLGTSPPRRGLSAISTDGACHEGKTYSLHKLRSFTA